MLNNTGNISFYLGVTFIIISLTGFVFAYVAARKKLLEPEALSKMIELGKWVIGSVAIIVSGSIISDGFKEREQDVKELEFFDKYVSTITQVEGVEKRWLLCQYFAAVSPEGQMRDGWIAYQKILDPVYKEYKEATKEIEQLSQKDSLNKAESKRLRVLQNAANQLDQKLITEDPKSAEPVIYIQYGNRDQKDLASQIRTSLQKSGYDAPGIEFIQNYRQLKTNEIRYFKESDLNTAMAIQTFLKTQGIDAVVARIGWYSTKAAPGTIELWLK